MMPMSGERNRLIAKYAPAEWPRAPATSPTPTESAIQMTMGMMSISISDFYAFCAGTSTPGFSSETGAAITPLMSAATICITSQSHP